MINLDIENICLSSSLPDRFTLTQVGNTAQCTVSLDGTDIYSTTLYADNGTAVFYDLRSLVENHMRSNGMTFASFCFEARYEDNTMEVMEDLTIVYSAIKHSMESDEVFLKGNFLSTRRNYTVPRNKDMVIGFFADGDEQIDVHVDCRFMNNGEVMAFEYQEQITSREEPAYYFVDMRWAYVASMCFSQGGSNLGTLVAATVRAGERSKTVFYTEERTSLSFLFRNAFNVQEYIHITAKETMKTDISRKEAVCQGMTSFYDESIERWHSMETCHLTEDEALWFNEFLTSHDISLLLEGTDMRLPVIVSDITSEINFSPSEQKRMKFSWKFADNNDWRSIVQPIQVFNDNFNPVFQ